MARQRASGNFGSGQQIASLQGEPDSPPDSSGAGAGFGGAPTFANVNQGERAVSPSPDDIIPAAFKGGTPFTTYGKQKSRSGSGDKTGGGQTASPPGTGSWPTA